MRDDGVGSSGRGTAGRLAGWVAALACLMVAATGCGSPAARQAAGAPAGPSTSASGAAGDSGASAGSTAGTPSPGSDPAGSAAPGGGTGSGPLVTLARTGGLAGIGETTVVLQNGDAVRTSRGRGRCVARLAGTEVATLRAQLARIDFAALRRAGQPDPVPDGFVYLITYRGSTVKVGEKVPAALENVLHTLAGLADRPCSRLIPVPGPPKG